VREEETGRRGSKTGAETDIAMTISVAEEATASSAGDNRACSNGRDRKDKCGGSERVGARGRDSSKTGFLCYGSGQREELLCLWEFWAHGPPL